MFFLLPIFFENFTIPASRTIADCIFLMIVFILFFSHKKININKFGLLYIATVACILIINAANGFANVSSDINLEIFDKLKWLITDRGINDFVPLGDYYRNTLIYLRYLLLPIYFSVGYQIALLYGRKKIINNLWLLLFTALILNTIYGLAKGDVRLTGFFDNTATLASLSLLCIFLSINLHSKIKLICTFFVGFIALVLSQTASAFLGLAVLLFVIIFKIKKHHLKSIVVTISISLIVGSIGLMPSVMEFLAKYLYIGSLINRLNTWSTIIGYYNSASVIMLGLGSFPVFADNLLIWLISGFGLVSIIIYRYLVNIGNHSKECAIFISIIVWQGMLFPGFLMPYMLITTFMILGIFSIKEEEEGHV